MIVLFILTHLCFLSFPVNVSIEVLDVDDNSPKFNVLTFTADLTENSPVGTPITLTADMTVSDKDKVHLVI